jgi:hypothetical protein
MTRGGATALFLVAGTLFNLIATGIAFVLLLVLYGFTLGRILPPTAAPIALLVSFILAVILGGLAYRQGLLVLRTKMNLDEYLGGKNKN